MEKITEGKEKKMAEEKAMCIGHAQRLSAVEESAKSAHKRIDALDSLTQSVNNLAISVSEMAVGMRQLEKSSANLSQKIDCLEAAPGKRWDLIVTEIIKLIVAAAAGFLLSMLF